MIRDLTFHFFRSANDNIVNDETKMVMSWPDVIDLFSKHRVTSIKNDLGFIAGEFKELTDDDVLFASWAEYEVDGSIKAEHIILDKDQCPYVARKGDNMLWYECIVLDYDGSDGMTIADAQERFAGIEHIGYTSYNHLSDGKTHKFRVVLPFKTPCPINEWVSRRGVMAKKSTQREGSILDFAGTDDRSTVARARIFFFPSHVEGNEDKAMSWHTTGEWLDWELFTPAPVMAPAEIPVRVKPTETGGNGHIIGYTFDMVQFMKDQGLYVRHNGGRKHEVNCPLAHEHASSGGTVVYEGVGAEWPSFYCAHKHGSGWFYSYWKEQLGAGWMRPYCETEAINRTSNDMKKVRALSRALQQNKGAAK